MMRIPRVLVLFGGVFLMIVMASMSYFSLKNQGKTLSDSKVVPQLVVTINDGICKWIKMDPIAAYKLNKFIDSSPYLKVKKDIFLKQYYPDQKRKIELYGDHALRLYMSSQLSSHFSKE